MVEVKLEELEIGKRYQIDFDDCCVQGELVGAFLGWDSSLDGEDDSLVYHRAKFDFGEIGGWAWKASLLTTGAADKG